jgi:hypothetical protein
VEIPGWISDPANEAVVVAHKLNAPITAALIVFLEDILPSVVLSFRVLELARLTLCVPWGARFRRPGTLTLFSAGASAIRSRC